MFKDLTSIIIIFIAIWLKAVIGYTTAALNDQITNLPGSEKLKITFNQFSGYLTINAETGKNIHYWFVEAEEDPASAPLVFWTNGGPGCSGLIGFFTEQGPFRPQADGSLNLNDYAWNKIANMVFIEQPIGTGFSYSNTKDDYRMDDQIAASDNYAIIQEFLIRFPEYASQPLYTTAESYGGHYMPQLALYIVNQNGNPTTSYTTKLNYKGFAVGNPLTDNLSEYPFMFFTYYGHQLISKPLWDKYEATCYKQHKIANNITECEQLEVAMGLEKGNLNPYALDYPVCVEDSTDKGINKKVKGSRAQAVWTLNFMLPDHIKSIIMPTTQEEYEPCGADYTVTYLNRDDVKVAIHVNTSITWEECSTTLRYNTADRLIPMQPIYEELLRKNSDLSILVYSGDDDSVCSTLGTQEWIWSLGFRPTSKKSYWQPWIYNGQTAGFKTNFEVPNSNDFAFVTVHRAGHEVPTYVPAEALDLFQKYLNGYWFQ